MDVNRWSVVRDILRLPSLRVVRVGLVAKRAAVMALGWWAMVGLYVVLGEMCRQQREECIFLFLIRVREATHC
jgi:hypothetical protein